MRVWLGVVSGGCGSVTAKLTVPDLKMIFICKRCSPEVCGNNYVVYKLCNLHSVCLLSSS